MSRVDAVFYLQFALVLSIISNMVVAATAVVLLLRAVPPLKRKLPVFIRKFVDN